MTKSMTKYQLEHFKDKVKRQFEPYIEEQELVVKQFRTKAIDHAVKGLAKKMGADKVLNELKKAEKQLANARATARTFFEKKKPKDEELSYNLRSNRTFNDELSVSDCEEQLREWASSLADREIEKRPEGKKLKQLKDTKQQAIDTVMEAGCPDELIKQLTQVSQCIGLSWNTELKRISIEAN
tara:strand:+ start:44 stop:592 length:549 start_codon:yes stop_codon:yes gene_type:complete